MIIDRKNLILVTLTVGNSDLLLKARDGTILHVIEQL